MDRTNMFFLLVAGGAAWFIWREYQKQKDDQARMFAQRQIQTTSIGPRATDYAEKLSQEQNWFREAEMYGG